MSLQPKNENVPVIPRRIPLNEKKAIIVIEEDSDIPWFITNSQEFCNLMKTMDPCEWMNTFSPHVRTSGCRNGATWHAIQAFSSFSEIEMHVVEWDEDIVEDYTERMEQKYEELTGIETIHYTTLQRMAGE